jgi:hypothetical protein
VIAVIHSNKFENALLSELVELGLATKPEDWSEEWHTLDPLTAILYMTFLAERMKQHKGLPEVTDEPILNPLLRDIQSDDKTEPQAALALASLVIETAIPANLEQVSARMNCAIAQAGHTPPVSCIEGVSRRLKRNLVNQETCPRDGGGSKHGLIPRK